MSYTFYIKTESKTSVDGVALFIDDDFVKYWSGKKDWKFFEHNLPAGTHKIEWQYITDGYGHQDNSKCWIDDITFPGGSIVLNDVDEIGSDEMISVYPNPANDVIFLKGNDIQYVEIYNSLGMIVLSRNITDAESMNIAGFASGVYFVRTFDKNDKISTTKFIKK